MNLTFLVEREGGDLTLPPDPSILGLDLISRLELGALDLRPPIADRLQRSWEYQFDVPACYLGPLWVDDPE